MAATSRVLVWPSPRHLRLANSAPAQTLPAAPRYALAKPLAAILPTVEAQQYWTRIFNKMEEGLNTWDYAWVYASWLRHGLTVRPKINMIANIGFGVDATHTTQNENLPCFSSPSAMVFPLSHPACVEIDEEADSRIEWVSFSGMDARIIANVRAKMVKSKKKMDE